VVEGMMLSKGLMKIGRVGQVDEHLKNWKGTKTGGEMLE